VNNTEHQGGVMAIKALENAAQCHWIRQGLPASKMSATRLGGRAVMPNEAVILLVEDDRVDIMTVQRASKKIDISNPLYVARTGAEALGMLRGDGFPRIEPTPSLILLDLNLPKMGGIEFLKELRADPVLRPMRVIVLTSSDEPSDQAAAFEYEVDDYIVKPHSFDEFSHAMSTILANWSGANAD
jgi:CheY-like chemotaxis protein